MAAPKSQRDNADAFDDLLGQLVDELAMTPTMVPEPEPEPEPEPPPTVPVQEVYHAPIQEAPPPQSNLMPLAVGGGLGVAGIAIAVVMLMRPDPPKEEPVKAPVAEVKKDPAPPVAAPPPVQPLPGQPGQPGQPGMPVGTGLPGQPIPGQPLDPNAAAGTPGAPGTTPATTDKKPAKKPSKKPTSGGSTGTKKAEPKKKSEVVDPFG